MDKDEHDGDRRRSERSSSASGGRVRKHRRNDANVPRIGLSRRETLREAATRKKSTSTSRRRTSKSHKENSEKINDDTKKRRSGDG